jgi:U1 small nuclear ribonucleoprotein 70kDa
MRVIVIAERPYEFNMSLHIEFDMDDNAYQSRIRSISVEPSIFVRQRKYIFDMSAIGLPAHILALFVPRPPVDYIKPIHRKRQLSLDGIADYVSKVELKNTQPSREVVETPAAKKSRRHEEKLQVAAQNLQESIKDYKCVTLATDPHRTLFVSRLSYDTTERELKREFDPKFGKVTSVKIIYDRQGMSRGYAFIEFEREQQMRDAYKQCEHLKIGGRHVIVDIERARIDPKWLPRRLGGGKGVGRNFGKKKIS